MTKDFEDLFALFAKYGVRSLVVGGHAVAFHAKPRFTKDIDVFVERSEDNASRIMKALTEFGFGEVGVTSADFLRENFIVQLGFPPNRIDLLTSLTGVTFDAAWPDKVAGKFGNQDVFYIGRSALIANKKAVGRPQDTQDVQWLEDYGPTLEYDK